MNKKKPSKIMAYLSILTGGVLLLSGIAAAGGYLGLRLFRFFGAELLVDELGVTAAVFLGLVGGGLAVVHGFGSLLNRRSWPLKLPPFYLFWIAFALVLGVGNLVLLTGVSQEFLFPPLFLLGALLPTAAILAWSFRALGWPVTWRQGALMFVAGSTLSVAVIILLDSFLPYVFFLLVEPLGYLTEEFLSVFYSGGPEFFERLFFSPLLIFYLLYIAFQAPFPEEFAKVLGPGLMGARITNERQAFAVGLASGAGFAILENMLYQGIYADWQGWTWGGITALRGIGAVNHSLWTAIIALALYRERERKPGWFGRLGRAYLVSVGLHTLWNGGYLALLYLLGLDQFAESGATLPFYGEYIEASLIIILLVLSLGMWWLLRKFVHQIARGVKAELSPALISRRALAGWAFACVLVIVPVGAALGKAWGQIRAVFLGG